MPPDRPLERQLRELAAVHQSLRALTSTLELPEILRAVLDGIKTFTAAEGLSLLLYDRQRDELVFSATETLRESALLGLPPTTGPGAASWAARAGESTLAEDGRGLEGAAVDVSAITASVGVATFPDDGADAELFRAADAAMYAVKRRGKNGVGVAAVAMAAVSYSDQR